MTDPASRLFAIPQAGQRLTAEQMRAALERGPATTRTAAPQTATREAATRQIAARAVDSVEQAIANAARATSVDFGYLVAQAQVESAMNPQARAATSSASGLYQFIESTWLDTMKRHGSRFGMGDIAAQIATTPGGSAYVADPSARAAILDMRNDPQIAALMAAGLAEDNRAALMPILGRQPEPGELYLAHFLGAGGAGRFLSEMQADPRQNAADLFRRPAAANQAVFYDRSGAPRSLAGVMDYLGTKLARAMEGVPTGPGAMPGAMPQGDYRRYLASSAPFSAAGPAVPYLITAAEVFEPREPAQITGGAPVAPGLQPAPRIPAAATLPLPGTPHSAPSPAGSRSMSNLLGASWQASGASELASPQSALNIQRAYDRLRALGL